MEKLKRSEKYGRYVRFLVRNENLFQTLDYQIKIYFGDYAVQSINNSWL